MKLILFIVILALSWSRAAATTYFLSSKGDDQRSGKSNANAWRTLARLHAATSYIQAGDSILLERGSVFIGTLNIRFSGLIANEVYIGAYGVGYKPVISGAEEIKNWTPLKQNIWMAECHSCTTEPGNFFMDGKFQPLGRYPNEGYRTMSCLFACETSLSDSSLTFADGYWNNAEVVVKSSRWTLDNMPVNMYRDKTFNFSSSASYLLKNGFGYFIQKHLATLDQSGEWFFDAASNKIYVYLHPGVNPNQHTMEVSVHQEGLNVTGVHDLIVENLAFEYHATVAVTLKSSDNISLRLSDIVFPGKNGVEVISCSNPRLENNRITDANNNGVEWRNNVNGSFINNFILRTGQHPGRCLSGNGTYNALSIASDVPLAGKNIFQYNTIDSTGYLGIDFRTGHTQIKNNVVSNFCMMKDDGAGIYTWGNEFGDNVIEGNIVLNGIGSGAGTVNSSQRFSSGIYIDDRSSDILIKNNTVAYCATAGIFLHNAKKITVSGNTLFGNGNALLTKERGQLYIKRDAIVSMASNALNLNVTQNKLVATHETSSCIYLSGAKKQDLESLGDFNLNQYSSPTADRVVTELYNQQDLCEAAIESGLPSWQGTSGKDDGSSFKAIPARFSDPSVKNLILNGTMTAGISGWVAWPERVAIIQDKTQQIDGPSLKVTCPAGQSEALLYHSGLSLNSKKLYRLSFSAMGAKNGKVESVPLMAIAPWQALGDYTCFSIGTAPKTYIYYFQPEKNCKDARVNFKSNGTFWIDNVTLQEVTTDKYHNEESIKLIYNPTKNDKAISISLHDKYLDVDGKRVPHAFILPAYSSKILFGDRVAQASRKP